MEPQATPTPPTPPIPTPPTPDPIQPPVQPMPLQEQPNSKISQKLLIPSIILLVIAVILVAFKLILTKKVITPPQPSPTASTQPTPSPTSDPTANWKTHTNTKYEFGFKCPSTSAYKIAELTTKDGVKFPYNQESCSENQNQINISVWKIINQEVFTLESKTKELSGASLKPIDYKETLLGQNKMVTYKEQNLSNQIERSVALIVLDDKYIRIDGFSENYFDQILSTFRFTE